MGQKNRIYSTITSAPILAAHGGPTPNLTGVFLFLVQHHYTAYTVLQNNVLITNLNNIASNTKIQIVYW